MTKKYIIDNNMVEILISYIGQEVEAAENHSDSHYRTKVKERLTHLLWTIYSSYFYSINGSINKPAIYTLILRLLEKSCFSDTSFFNELIRYMEQIFKHRDDSLNLSYFSENIEKVVVISLDCDDSTNLEDPNELLWDRFKELRHELSLQRKTIVPIDVEEISLSQCKEEISKIEDPDFLQINGNSETRWNFRNIAKYYDHIEMSCGDWKFSASNFKKPVPEMRQLNYWEMKQDPYNNIPHHQMLQTAPNNWISPMNSASSCYSPQIYTNPNFVPVNSRGSIGSMSPNYYPAVPHQVHQYQHQVPFRSPSSNMDCPSYNNPYQYNMHNSPIYHSSPVSSPTLLQGGNHHLLFRPKSAPLPSSSSAFQPALYRNFTPSESGSNFVSSSNISTNSMMVVDSTVNEFQSQIVSCSNTHQLATTKDTFNHKEIQVSMDKDGHIERKNSLQFKSNNQNKSVEYNDEPSTSREYFINSVKTQNCESSSENAAAKYSTLPQNEINSNSNEFKSTNASRTEECNLNNADDDLFPAEIIVHSQTAETIEKPSVESIQNENEQDNRANRPLDSANNNVIIENFDQIEVVPEINAESSQNQQVVNIITNKVEADNQLIESTKEPNFEENSFPNCASVEETTINQVSNISKECDSLNANNGALELVEVRELKETICERPEDLIISTEEEVNSQITETDDNNSKLIEIGKSSVNDEIHSTLQNKPEENIEAEIALSDNSAMEKPSEEFIEMDQSLTDNNVVIENVEPIIKELSVPTREQALFEEVAPTELSINPGGNSLESNEALKVAENTNVIIEHNSNSTKMTENEIVCSDSLQTFTEKDVTLQMEQSPEDIVEISVNAHDKKENSELSKDLTNVPEEKEADFQITVATEILEEFQEKDAVIQSLDNQVESVQSIIIANNNVEDKNIIEPAEEQNIEVKDSVAEESDSLIISEETAKDCNVAAAEQEFSQIVVDNSHNITDTALSVITNNEMENNIIIEPAKNQNIEAKNSEEVRIDEISISQESDSLSIIRDLLKAGQSLENANNAVIAEEEHAGIINNNNQMEEIINEPKNDEGENLDILINNNNESKTIDKVVPVELEDRGKKLEEMVKPIEEIKIEISSRELKANIEFDEEFESSEATTAIKEDKIIKELTETLQEILADNSEILQKEEPKDLITCTISSVEDNPSILDSVNISKDNSNKSSKKMDKNVTEEVLLEEDAENSYDDIDIEDLLDEADDPLKINASDHQQQNNTEILENSTISENGLKTLQVNNLSINKAKENSIEVSVDTHGLQLITSAIEIDLSSNSTSNVEISTAQISSSFIEKDPLNLSEINKTPLILPNNNTSRSSLKTKAELKTNFAQFEDITDDDENDDDDDDDDVPLVDRYKNRKSPNLIIPKSPIFKNFENQKEKSSIKKLGNLQDKEPKNNQKKEIQSLNLKEQKNSTIRRPRGRPKKIMLKPAESEQINKPAPVSAIAAPSPTKKHTVFLQKYENENKSNNNSSHIAEVSSNKKPYREKSSKEKLRKDSRKVQFQEVAIIGETTVKRVDLQKVATVNSVKADGETLKKDVKYNSSVLKAPTKVAENVFKDCSIKPVTESNADLNNAVDKDDFQHITAENSEKLPSSDNDNSFSKTDNLLEVNGIIKNCEKSKPSSDAVQPKKEAKSKEFFDSKKSDNLKNKLDENAKKGKIEVKKKDEFGGTKNTQQSKKDKEKSSQQLNNNEKVIIKSDNKSREKNEKTSKNRSSKTKEVVPPPSSDRKENKKIIETKEDTNNINLKYSEKTTKKHQKTIKPEYELISPAKEEKSSRSDGSSEKTSKKIKISKDTGKIITSKEAENYENTKKCSNGEKLKTSKSDKTTSKNKSVIDEKNKGIREDVDEKAKKEQLFDTSKEKKTVRKEKILNSDDAIIVAFSKAVTLNISTSKKKSDKKEKKSSSTKCEKLFGVDLVENLNKDTIISSAPAEVPLNDNSTIKDIKEEKNVKRPVEKLNDVATNKEMKEEQIIEKSKCSLKSQKSHSLEETVKKLQKRKVSLTVVEADNVINKELVEAVKEDEKKDTVMAKKEDVVLAMVKTKLLKSPSTEIPNKSLEVSRSLSNEEVSPILEQPNNKVNFINEEKISNVVPASKSKRKNSINLSSNPIIEQKVKKMKLMVFDEETQVNDNALTKDNDNGITVKTEQNLEEHSFPFNFSAAINNCASSTPEKVGKTAKSFESSKRKEYPADYEEFVRKAPKTESSPTLINTTSSFAASTEIPSLLLEKNNVNHHAATFCGATTQYSDGYLLNPNRDGAIAECSGPSSSVVVDGAEGEGYSPRNNDTSSSIPTIGNVFAETTVDIGTFLDSAETASNKAAEHSYALNKLQTAERDIINQSSPISSATANNDSQNNQMDVWIGQNEGLASSGDNNGAMKNSEIAFNIFDTTDDIIENLSFSVADDIINDDFDDYFSHIMFDNKESSGCASSDNNQPSAQHLQKSPQKSAHISVDSSNKSNNRVCKQYSIMETITKKNSPIKEIKNKTPYKDIINKKIIPPQSVGSELPVRTSGKKRVKPPPRKNDPLKKTPTTTTTTTTTKVEMNKESLINNKEQRISMPQKYTISNDLFDQVRNSKTYNEHMKVHNKSMPQLAQQSSSIENKPLVYFENRNRNPSDTKWIENYEKKQTDR